MSSVLLTTGDGWFGVVEDSASIVVESDVSAADDCPLFWLVDAVSMDDTVIIAVMLTDV